MQIAPKNWSSFQHYRDRSPPWIKLHKSLLDDRVYQRLPLASRALAPMLWLLASESKDGIFDGSVEDLAFRLRAPEEEIQDGLGPLLDAGFFAAVVPAGSTVQAPCAPSVSASPARRHQGASTALADCAQPATPETETESKGEGEADSPIGDVGGADVLRCPTKKIIDLYHEVLPELPRVRLQTDGRTRALARTWRWVMTSFRPDSSRRATTADEGLAWFREYFERAAQNDFLMGRTAKTGAHAGWQCDLDFLLSERGKKHVIERTEAVQ